MSVGALAMSSIAGLAWAEGPDSPPGTGTMMFLRNFPGPFGDRSLAAELGRAVVSAKYPLAVLSRMVKDGCGSESRTLVKSEVDQALATREDRIGGRSRRPAQCVPGLVAAGVPHDTELRKHFARRRREHAKKAQQSIGKLHARNMSGRVAEMRAQNEGHIV